MAGARGNVAWIAFQQQTAKGTKATLAKEKAVRTGVTSGVISPVREIGRLSETDANRDQGVAYVKKDALKGNPDIYVRPNGIALALIGVLGEDEAKENVGKTAQEHLIKPTNSLPYFTFWTMLNESSTGGATGPGATELFEEHENCIISDVNIKGAAGSPLTATLTVLGTTTKRLTANPVVGKAEDPGMENTVPFTFSNATVKFGGVETHIVSSIDLTINNKGTEQQTDKPTVYDIVVGKREVNVGFELFFENLDQYNSFHYGSTSGVTISPAIYETSMEFLFEIDATHSLELKFPHVAYEEFPLQPNPEGNPVLVAVKAVGQRSSEDIVKALVVNSRKKYS